MPHSALRRAAAALAASAFLALPAAAAIVTEDFSSNPFGAWTYGVGSNVSNQFVYNASAPAAWTGDATGQLEVHLDSNLPSVRLQRALDVTINDQDNFTLTTRFSMKLLYASTNNSMQIAFGLVNQGLSGGDRTGTATNYASDNVFHTVEFNYFPSVTFFGGPTLTPSVFGAQKGGGDAFANFASSFDTTPSLPQDVVLEAVLDYQGTTKILNLTINQVATNGTVTLVQSAAPMSLITPPGFSNYDTNFPWSVNAMAIMAYQDGFNQSGSDPSLQADLIFQRFEFVTPVPEPSVAVLFGAAAGGTLILRRRKTA
ncbi:MAG: PEP-CTERM sorting domain-containing protein [Verrucomicrobiae bacterium]|nr:PEP-CTERM sorting domain-containing protein [Verrucomicrobiae bacterium]